MMTLRLQGECSYRRADTVRQFNVGRVLVLSDPPRSDDDSETHFRVNAHTNARTQYANLTSVECLFSMTPLPGAIADHGLGPA